MPQPTVTAILNAHREGMIAKPSIESLKRSAMQAEEAGHTVEVVIVLDQPDPLTKEMISECSLSHHKIFVTTFGDLGRARNFAISVATGDYIALLDADDLWGVDWLTQAIDAARNRHDQVIWHPEVNVYFGAAKHIFRHVDMEDTEFDAAGLMVENYWTSLSFGARKYYLANPYPATDLKAGFGFEDWAWNMEVIANGGIHKVVRDSGHVIRRKPDSLARRTSDARAVPRPNNYLQHLISCR